MSTHNLCFEQKSEKYQNFLFENFHFLVAKFSIYLNRRVFIMDSKMILCACAGCSESAHFEQLGKHFWLGWNKENTTTFLAHIAKVSGRANLITPHPSLARLPSTPLNSFFSETPGPVCYKLHVKHSIKWGSKICTKGHGLLSKVLQCMYMEKHLKIFFSRTKWVLKLNFGI